MTSGPIDGVEALSRALDQAAALLDEVQPGQRSSATPCAEWTVDDLVAHLVRTPATFAQMLRGEQPDWAQAPAPVGDDRAERFRAAAADLMAAWQENADGPDGSDPDWQIAEVAVHTWDLATALGHPTDGLDPVLAERGLAFMTANLTADNRSSAFRPEQRADADADAYTRLAAFAGRRVRGPVVSPSARR